MTYDQRREAYEHGPMLKRGGSIKRRIARAVDTRDPQTPTAIVDLTQINTLPPDQVSDDYESLMRREG